MDSITDLSGTDISATDITGTEVGYIPVDTDCAQATGCTLAGDERFIIHLDGVILDHGHALPGAAAFLNAAAGRYMLISSNSRDTAKSMSTKLKRVGIDVSPDCIILAGEEAVRHVGETYPRARAIVVASRVLSHAARAAGLIHVQRDARVILIGRDTTWTYQRLALIANEMDRGALVIATNPETACRSEDGRLIPDTGSLLAALEAATGRKADCVIGQGTEPLTAIALKRLGVAAGRAVLITASGPCEDHGALRDGMRRLQVDPQGRGDCVSLDVLHRQVQLPSPRHRH